MSLTLEVCEPRELLALVPYQLGFHPAESLVLVSLRPPRGRVGLVARAEIDDLAHPDHGSGIAESLVTHLRTDGAGEMVLVLYTDEQVPPEPSPDSVAWRAVRAVRRSAGRIGAASVWVVSPTGYRRLGCPDLGCCPVEGRPLEELEATQVGAHMVLSGASVRSSRAELADLPEVPEEARSRAGAAAVAWRRARSAEGLRGAAHLDWLERSLDAWRKAVDGSATAAELGQVGAALDDVLLRDAVLVSFVPAAGTLPEDLVGAVRATSPDASTGEAVGRAVASIVDPDSGVMPGEEAELAWSALEKVVAHHDPAAAPGRTLLALIAWWRGDAALANAHLERAQPDGGYRLARLLRRALDAGMPPGWASVPAWSTRC